MRRQDGMALGLGFLLVSSAASAAVPKELEPLTFLLGEWDASGSGKPGEGTGSTSFVLRLQDRVIVRTNFADNPRTAKSPESRHDDLMVIHAASGGVGADYYDNEGHVLRYVVTSAGPGEASFVSEVVEGSPRFRLSYKLRPDSVLKGEFAIAPPGKPEAFAPYLAWESRRAKASVKAHP